MADSALHKPETHGGSETSARYGRASKGQIPNLTLRTAMDGQSAP
jgi:hypothetical protein